MYLGIEDLIVGSAAGEPDAIAAVSHWIDVPVTLSKKSDITRELIILRFLALKENTIQTVTGEIVRIVINDERIMAGAVIKINAILTIAQQYDILGAVRIVIQSRIDRAEGVVGRIVAMKHDAVFGVTRRIHVLEPIKWAVYNL